MQSGALQDLES